MNNQELHHKAVQLVMKYERKKGRKSNILKQGNRYDMESSGRKIEVKSSLSKKWDIELNEYNLEAFEKEKNFYVYVVYNIAIKPRLIILDRDTINSEMYIAKKGYVKLKEHFNESIEI